MRWEPIEVRLPDTLGVSISRWGSGNRKLGPNVVTYSREPGYHETCPGSTPECEAICYAKKVQGQVRQVWRGNGGEDVPPIPADARLLRLHVSGDFTTAAYICGWISRLMARPDVRAWVYTRSWRVPELHPSLEGLRSLRNVQMFASMDPTTPEQPPKGWRVAWLDGDRRGDALGSGAMNRRTQAGTMSYVCPEEAGAAADCESCRYCFDGRKGDVTFLRH